MVMRRKGSVLSNNKNHRKDLEVVNRDTNIGQKKWGELRLKEERKGKWEMSGKGEWRAGD